MSDNGAMKHCFKVFYHSFQKNTDTKTESLEVVSTQKPACGYILTIFITSKT